MSIERLTSSNPRRPTNKSTNAQPAGNHRPTINNKENTVNKESSEAPRTEDEAVVEFGPEFAHMAERAVRNSLCKMEQINECVWKADSALAFWTGLVKNTWVVKINDRQRRFLDGLVAGLGREEAYLAAFPKARSREAVTANACRLLKKPGMREYLERRQAEAEEKADMGMVSSRFEILVFLSAIVRTPPGAVDEMSWICEKFRVTKTAKEVRLPGKLQAIGWLSRMLGWEDHGTEQGETLGGMSELRGEAFQTRELPEVESGGTKKRWRPLSERQRLFADDVLAGTPQSRAYGAMYPQSALSGRRTNASKLMRNPRVRAYLVQRRAEMAEHVMAEAVATRQEVLEFLTAIIRTPVGAVEARSRICQSFKGSIARLPGKLAAVGKLVKLMGWDRPPKVEPKNELLDLLLRIRAGGGRLGDSSRTAD